MLPSISFHVETRCCNLSHSFHIETTRCCHLSQFPCWDNKMLLSLSVVMLRHDVITDTIAMWRHTCCCPCLTVKHKDNSVKIWMSLLWNTWSNHIARLANDMDKSGPWLTARPVETVHFVYLQQSTWIQHRLAAARPHKQPLICPSVPLTYPGVTTHTCSHSPDRQSNRSQSLNIATTQHEPGTHTHTNKTTRNKYIDSQLRMMTVNTAWCQSNTDSQHSMMSVKHWHSTQHVSKTLTQHSMMSNTDGCQCTSPKHRTLQCCQASGADTCLACHICCPCMSHLLSVQLTDNMPCMSHLLSVQLTDRQGKQWMSCMFPQSSSWCLCLQWTAAYLCSQCMYRSKHTLLPTP